MFVLSLFLLVCKGTNNQRNSKIFVLFIYCVSGAVLSVGDALYSICRPAAVGRFEKVVGFLAVSEKKSNFADRIRKHWRWQRKRGNSPR